VLLKRSVISILVALAAAGCGDILEGVGGMSSQFARGDETTTSRPPEKPGVDLRLAPITGLTWINDGLDLTGSASREVLIRDVWNRGGGSVSFVQAGRREVAMALPGVGIPTLVPAAVTHVSSQLVYDPQTASLSAATSAAFGYWVGEPYVLPRSEAQLMVLRVGLASSEEFGGINEVAVFNVEGGRELAWVEGGYIYQLFCRTGVVEEACLAIAGTLQPLALLAMLDAPQPPGG